MNVSGRQRRVIIVGGGPVGVGLAVDLGLRGIACTLIERREGLSNIPKGQNLTQRTLEHFYFWGLIQEIRAARVMPPRSPIGEWVGYRHLLTPYWHVTEGRSVVGRYYFQANDRLPQYRMEEVLRAKLATLPAVDARFGCTATEIAQHSDGVRVKVSTPGQDKEEILEADYLVGCDGGQSVVRTQAQIPRDGTAFNELMVLAVFRSRDLHEKLKMYPERSTYRVMHPDLKGYWQFFGRIDVGEGWFFHAPVPASTARDSFDFHAMLEDVAGFPFSCTFDHVGFWDLRVEVARHYRTGRIFIAGDAAHSHPPYGGYGLNNGLEDIRNLGWKLAAVIEGWGGEALLASYDAERRPVFKDIGDDFITARIAGDREFLDRHSPDRDLADFERAWASLSSEYTDRTFAYEPHYEGSPVVAGPPGGRSSAHGQHTLEARAGHHLPPGLLGDGRNVYETLGRGFTLLAWDAPDEAISAFCEAAGHLGVPLSVTRDTYRDGRMDYRHRLVLVRPDQFVAWASETAEVSRPDALGALRHATGHT